MPEMRVWTGTAWASVTDPMQLRGDGPPNGVVSAPPGTTYVDRLGTIGAWQWANTSGTGNTGWVVQYGDTGWRNITPSPLPATIASGSIYIRRTTEGIYLWLSEIVWAALTVPTNILDTPIPLAPGWTPLSTARTGHQFGDVDLVSQDVIIPYFPSNNMFLRFFARMTSNGFSTTVPAGGKPRRGVWFCGPASPSTWPTTWVGTPA